MGGGVGGWGGRQLQSRPRFIHNSDEQLNFTRPRSRMPCVWTWGWVCVCVCVGGGGGSRYRSNSTCRLCRICFRIKEKKPCPRTEHFNVRERGATAGTVHAPVSSSSAYHWPIIGGSCNKYHFCRDKKMLFATDTCLTRQQFCGGKRNKTSTIKQRMLYIFTQECFCRDKDVLSLQTRVCRETSFVATKLLSRQK